MAFSTFQENRTNAEICSIQFSSHNRIRLNGVPKFPEQLVSPLRYAIEDGWSRGIMHESFYYGAYEFQVSGAPWYGKGENGVNSRRLLASILTCLAKEGWVHLHSCDLTKKSNDKDTMFLEYQKPDPEAQTFGVSFNRTDRIRLIGPPESYLEDIFKDTVSSGWSFGIHSERYYYGAIELKLNGTPWFTSMGVESVNTKQLLCHLIAAFRNVGYKLYASVDICGRGGSDSTSDSSSLDAWIFRKVTQYWN